MILKDKVLFEALSSHNKNNFVSLNNMLKLDRIIISTNGLLYGAR